MANPLRSQFKRAPGPDLPVGAVQGAVGGRPPVTGKPIGQTINPPKPPAPQRPPITGKPIGQNINPAMGALKKKLGR